MLRITIDMFSGRPNPAWFITDRDESQRLLDVVGESQSLLAAPGAGFDGLGYREVEVTMTGDDPRPKGIPVQFAIGSTASQDVAGSGELARAVIGSMERYAEIHLPSHELTPLTAQIRDLALVQLQRLLSDPPTWGRPTSKRGNPLITTTRDPLCERCQYEVSQYNPGFWNAPTVQPYNNCYNYARNWRTDTFAQPGRAHDAQTGVMSCPRVTAAAMADGLHHRCDCEPPSEFPRRLMALVVGPGYDYHWYRHQRGGFWGTSPGTQLRGTGTTAATWCSTRRRLTAVPTPTSAATSTPAVRS